MTDREQAIGGVLRLLPLIEEYATDVSVESWFPDVADTFTQLAALMRAIRDAVPQRDAERPQVTPPDDDC